MPGVFLRGKRFEGLELAKSALQELRPTQPNISLAWVESQVLVKNRRAGLE